MTRRAKLKNMAKITILMEFSYSIMLRSALDLNY